MASLSAGEASTSSSSNSAVVDRSGEIGKRSYPDIFASVGDREISRQEFFYRVRGEIRGRFYHSRIPEGEREAFLRDAGQKLIDQVLLAQEAERRGISWDRQRVDEQIADITDQNKDNEAWSEQSKTWSPILKRSFREQSLVAALEAEVRNIEEPDEADIRAFYDANPDKFTQPEQLRASLILIAVPAYASGDDWEAARNQLLALKERIAQGEAFEELAAEYSSDPTASQGGDMGFLHDGMLGEEATKVVNELSNDEVSEPVRLLDGAALFKLTGKKPPIQTPYGQARQRARGLLMREQQALAWNGLKFELRHGTEVPVAGVFYTLE